MSTERRRLVRAEVAERVELTVNVRDRDRDAFDVDGRGLAGCDPVVRNGVEELRHQAAINSIALSRITRRIVASSRPARHSTYARGVGVPSGCGQSEPMSTWSAPISSTRPTT